MANSTPNSTATAYPLLASLASPTDLRAMSIPQLEALAKEIRQAICDQVQRSGGHLAPNLGVVELTIALHYVFDFAHDRLLFDVGHQCYPHKLLTGRLPLLGRLRTRDGMAGFPEPRESSFDLFAVGHAGTGISTAVGMARGDTLNREAFDGKDTPDGRRVVTLIGDASVVNGVAMEGLNNAGTLKRQFLVILNDNGMSISKPQGAIAARFDRLRISHFYSDLKQSAKSVLKQMPGGSLLTEAYHRAGEAAKAMINEDGATGAAGGGSVGSGWFEHFGLKAIGPIDGHDLPTLITFLKEARDFERPMVLHVKTIKGKGFAFSEQDSSTFHSPPAFKIDQELSPDSASLTGCRVELKSEGRSFTTAFADAMHSVMERDERVVACTAAMPDGTGLNHVMPRFPDRVWDTGICESHALDMMAGLAKTGHKPFLAVYSTFFQRAFDQAFQEAALQGLPVRLCLDRAGLVGGDGAVHHGFCDVALLRVLPNAVVMAAIDEPSLVAALEFMRAYDAGVSAVRYPRDNVSEKLLKSECPAFVMGRARNLTPSVTNPDLAVLAFGTPAIAALDAAQSLANEDVGHAIAVYDARFAKPVDTALIAELLEARVPIVTIEDHSTIGGFGSAVVEAASDLIAAGGHAQEAPIITRLGLPDRFIQQDSRSKQLAEVGLDREGLVKAFKSAIKHAQSSPHAAS